jgi:hypothetical protein
MKIYLLFQIFNIFNSKYRIRNKQLRIHNDGIKKKGFDTVAKELSTS